MNIFVDPRRVVPDLAEVPRVNTLQEAIAQAPPEGTGPFRIGIAPGTYREKITVDRPGVELLGPPLDQNGLPTARLVWDDWAGAPGPEGSPLGTFRTQTLAVVAPDFRAERLTIANDWAYPGPPGTTGTQAVALKTDGNSDRAVFVDCRLEGFQDTLYANAGRHVFERCFIEGHVDFIFGAGRAWFHGCTVACLDRPGRPSLDEPAGYICAPSTRAPHRWGFVFEDCRVIKGTPAPAPSSWALGRPWHPSFAPDTVNAAIFVRCWLDDHIRADAWTSMDSRPGGVLTTYHPEDALLFEYQSQGPGAVSAPSPRRRWWTEVPKEGWGPQVLAGWLPREINPGPT